MSLNKGQLKTDITTLLTTASAGSGNANANLNAFVNGLADAIEAYVKSGQINYTGGLMAGSTPVTGVINGNIS